MAFDFDALKPEAKKAAFANMDRKRLGTGARHKKLTGKQKDAVEHKGSAKISGKLGSGSVKGRLSPADQDSGSVGGRLPIAKARPSAPKPAPKAAAAPAKPTPDTPEGRFDEHFTGFMKKLTMSRHGSYAGMVEVRKELDAKGISRAEQDAHLKRMSAEGKIHIVPEDNRKAMRQEDHDAAIHIGGEPNDLVMLDSAPADDHAKMRAKAAKEKKPAAPPKPVEKAAPKDTATLAKEFLELHGQEHVEPRIAFLEKKQRLLPGQRAELAALKTLRKK